MKYTRYKFSRNLAWEIIIKEHISELPIKVIPLCKRLGIKVIKYSEAPGVPKEGDGFSTVVGKRAYIFYNDGVIPQRQRFTIAHEIGHILLKHNDIESEDREAEADVFASRLLMPACILKECNVKSSEDIMLLCDVSKAAAEIRLKRLKVLSERNKFYLHPLERKVKKRFKTFIKCHRLNREVVQA